MDGPGQNSSLDQGKSFERIGKNLYPEKRGNKARFLLYHLFFFLFNKPNQELQNSNNTQQPDYTGTNKMLAL
jgi:hypothetical protein